jgi:putative peptidoglycan lipid II flippase
MTEPARPRPSLARNIATVGGYTMASRVLGFARDILIASVLGAGFVSDAFFVAFKLPNFFRRLFAEGAFNAAFVPMFAGVLTAEGRDAARRFAGEALSVMVVTVFVFVSVLQMAMPLAMFGLAPGFAATPETFDLAVELTQITFPYLLFISLVSLMGGVLNSLGRFAAAAATPILLNVTLIAALLLLAPRMETAGHALAWGVAAAGLVQFLWLATALARAGMSLRLTWPRLTPRVRELLWLMLPGVIGAGVVQINLLADLIIASFLPPGSISFLYFADRVNQLPLGVIGVAIGTALLPALARNVAAGETDAAHHSQNRALEVALLFTVPAALALIVIAMPVISVLFERGAFDTGDSRATALALMAYAAGLPAYVLIKVLTPGYFARKDTATPVRIAALSVAVNIVLNLVLMVPLQHVGLALATAIAAWLNAALLARGLIRRGHWRLDARLRRRAPRTVLAALIMAAGVGAAMVALGDFASRGTLPAILTLAALVTGGAALFAAAALVLGAARPSEARALLRRRAAAD